MATDASSRATRVVAALLALLLLAGGLAVTAVATWAVRRSAEAQAQAAMDRRAAAVQDAVTAQARRYTDAVALVASAAGAAAPLSYARFQDLSAPLATMALAGTTAIVYVSPGVRTDQVADLQASWRLRGATGLVLRSGPGPQHSFAIVSRPLDGRPARAAGQDFSRSEALTAAEAESERRNGPAITNAYHLLIDRSLPPAQRQLSFSVLSPIWDATSGQQLMGWALLGIRGQDFMHDTLARSTQGLLDVRLQALGEGGRTENVATLEAGYQDRRDLTRTVSVTVAQRQWTLQVAASSRVLASGASADDVYVGLVGSALAVLLAALVFVLATGRARARSQVALATAELREQRDFSAQLLQGLSDLGEGVTLSQDGRFTYVNAAYSRLVGRSTDELLALPAIVELAPGDEHAAWVDYRRRRAAGDTTPLHTSVVHASGAIVPVEAATLGIDSAEGLVHVSVTRDLTPQVRVQRALAASVADLEAANAGLLEANRFKDDVVAMLSHDLRQPLTSTVGFCEFVLDEWDELPDEERREFIGRATRSAHWVNDLLEDILTMARIDQGRPVPSTGSHDAAGAVAEAVTRLGTRGSVVEVRAVAGLEVLVDPTHLQQILGNLLGNALKYGRAPVRAVTRRAAGAVVIEVTDSGDGVPAEFVPHLFERFTRASTGTATTTAGTGLGLYIAHTLAAANEGTLHYRRSEGGGSRFTLTLPIAGGAQVPAQGSPVAVVEPVG